MDNTVLEVKNLTKQFGNFNAVNNVSFSLKEGEILGFLGINGAGKTTTLQMLLGILTPTKGNIHYFGKNFFEHREEILERVNFSSTYTNLPWNMTIKENMHFLSYLYKIQNRSKKIDEVISLFKLEKLVNKTMGSLSAGQLTRVNLAKSFLNDPDILLLDEPTASLDVDIASYIRKFLLERKKTHNISIIITSHNMAEIEEISNRVIIIDKGKLIADNTPDTLAKSIQTAHVELRITDGLKRAIEYCTRNKLSYRVTERHIVVDVKEKHIGEFLHNLMDQGIMYDEISIEKPTLEDYFLEVTTTQKTDEEKTIENLPNRE